MFQFNFFSRRFYSSQHVCMCLLLLPRLFCYLFHSLCFSRRFLLYFSSRKIHFRNQELFTVFYIAAVWKITVLSTFIYFFMFCLILICRRFFLFDHQNEYFSSLFSLPFQIADKSLDFPSFWTFKWRIFYFVVWFARHKNFTCFILPKPVRLNSLRLIMKCVCFQQLKFTIWTWRSWEHSTQAVFFTHSALVTVNTQSKMALPCLFLLFFIINKTNTSNGWMSCWHEHEYNIHGHQYHRNAVLWDAHFRIADSCAQTAYISALPQLHTNS